jgi:Protein of unknown function (DUF1566)
MGARGGHKGKPRLISLNHHRQRKNSFLTGEIMRFGFHTLGAVCLAAASLCSQANASPTQVPFTPMPKGATNATAYGFQDPRTCLIWGRNPNGFGVATPYQYVGTNGQLDGATIRIKTFNLGGFTDWRLPTIIELQDMYLNNTGLLPGSWWSTPSFPAVIAGQFWSSTLGGNFDPTKAYSGLVSALDNVGKAHPEALGSQPRYTWPVRYETCPAAVASPFTLAK